MPIPQECLVQQCNQGVMDKQTHFSVPYLYGQLQIAYFGETEASRVGSKSESIHKFCF